MLSRSLPCLAVLLAVLACADDRRAVPEHEPSALAQSATASDSDEKATQVALVRGAEALWNQESFEDALRLVDLAIETSGNQPELVEFRCDLLFKLKRPQELLEASMLYEEIADRKTPWNYLKIADAHIFLGDKEEALRWVEKAVREREFRKFTAFDRDYYDLLRDDPRFERLLAEIHEDLGVGKPAKDFTTTLIDGGQLTLSSLRGQVTLIDFWATWCAPCRKELPNLKSLYTDFGRRGFEIVSIGLDEPDALDKARIYIRENDLPWRLSLSGQGWGDEVASLYKVNGLPSTWLIDREGVLRHVDVHGEELRTAVETLVDG